MSATSKPPAKRRANRKVTLWITDEEHAILQALPRQQQSRYWRYALREQYARDLAENGGPEHRPAEEQPPS